jgi:hypothetical protein
MTPPEIMCFFNGLCDTRSPFLTPRRKDAKDAKIYKGRSSVLEFHTAKPLLKRILKEANS